MTVIKMPKLKTERIGEENISKRGQRMKIVEYYGAQKIVVEFDDKNKTKVNTTYALFKSGSTVNPYAPSVFGVGITGAKYKTYENGKKKKEYIAWCHILARCYKRNYVDRTTYDDVICCNEWLLYENFYEWLHSQRNFDKWLHGYKWAIDKDILVKGNKVYSPETCCLVSMNVNGLFVKADKRRGDLPIGVSYSKRNNAYSLSVSRKKNNIEVKYFKSPIEAFNYYKQIKESIIKQTAQNEFDNGNITKECYNAMMRYEVEITD